MILYPESPLIPSEIHKFTGSAVVRGAVGHNVGFELNLIILANRVWKWWTEEGADDLFGEHTPRLLAVFDKSIAAAIDEKPPPERDAVIDAQLVELERRLSEAGRVENPSESFIFVPLPPYFLGGQSRLHRRADEEGRLSCKLRCNRNERTSWSKD